MYLSDFDNVIENSDLVEIHETDREIIFITRWDYIAHKDRYRILSKDRDSFLHITVFYVYYEK